MNYNIPHFRALVRKSYFTKTDTDGWYDVICFAVQSIAGKILTFHVLTDDGMMRSRVPISEIYAKEPTKDIPYHYKQLWDCFDETAHIIAYDFLQYHRAQIVLKDKTLVWGTYLFTIDWFDNPYSNEPQDYKCGHVFKADDGYLLCMPNNRLRWVDSNWVTKDLPSDLSIFKVDTELLSVESASKRWVSADSNSFFYDIVETAPHSQLQ